MLTSFLVGRSQKSNIFINDPNLKLIAMGVWIECVGTRREIRGRDWRSRNTNVLLVNKLLSFFVKRQHIRQGATPHIIVVRQSISGMIITADKLSILSCIPLRFGYLWIAPKCFGYQRERRCASNCTKKYFEILRVQNTLWYV